MKTTNLNPAKLKSHGLTFERQVWEVPKPQLVALLGLGPEEFAQGLPRLLKTAGKLVTRYDLLASKPLPV